MALVNLQTWTRITRIDLAHLAVAIGNVTLENLRLWPSTGEGREIKANSEKISRLLESTHDKKDIASQFDHLERIISLFEIIKENKFFRSHLSRKKYTSRYGQKITFDYAISESISKFVSFSNLNRPNQSGNHTAASTSYYSGVTQVDEGAIADLERLTPKQKNAPLQFEFSDGYLRLKPQISNAKTKKDEINVISARQSLNLDVQSLILTLNESNSDPRLIVALEEISQVIASNCDVIKLGFLSFTCDSLFVRFSEQLSDIASARFLALSTGLGMYVAQFSQWREFVENASESNVQDSDLDNAYDIGVEMIPALKNARDLVDPEVPKSIQLLLEATKNPKLSRNRALYGMIRTLENLFSVIFSEFAKTYAAASDGARTGLKHAATALVASSLLVIAAGAAAQLSPIAERTLKAKWMKQAAELVEKAIE